MYLLHHEESIPNFLVLISCPSRSTLDQSLARIWAIIWSSLSTSTIFLIQPLFLNFLDLFSQLHYHPLPIIPLDILLVSLEILWHFWMHELGYHTVQAPSAWLIMARWIIFALVNISIHLGHFWGFKCNIWTQILSQKLDFVFVDKVKLLWKTYIPLAQLACADDWAPATC